MNFFAPQSAGLSELKLEAALALLAALVCVTPVPDISQHNQCPLSAMRSRQSHQNLQQ
jgi:hypothetical protein